MAKTPDAVVGEYGHKSFLFPADADLSGYTELTITLKKPDGTSETFNTGSTPAVTLGATLLEYQGRSFAANQYVTKIVGNGDFDQEGVYQVTFSYTDASGVIHNRKPHHFYVRALTD